MLMVIFGAGASYDSSPDFPPPQPQPRIFDIVPTPPPPLISREAWRPPLANALFTDPHGIYGDIVQRYSKLLPILDRLRQFPTGRSLEQQLELFQNEADAEENPDRERKRQLLAVRYFLSDQFQDLSREWLKKTRQVTNYVALIDQIRQYTPEDEQVALVTFNYDSLLDNALLSFNYNPQTDIERHFDAHPYLKLFRPHGSANWSRLVNQPKGRLQPFHLIEQADQLKLSDEYVVAVATDPHQIFNYDRPIIPAIAIPVQTKTDDTFEWPQSHRKYLEALLPKVTKILIIGWQGREAHFMDVLKVHLPFHGRRVANIWVVGKDSDDGKEILHRFAADLGQSGYRTQHHHPDGGFSKFVASGEVEAVIRM